jgi:hypothetical protein
MKTISFLRTIAYVSFGASFLVLSAFASPVFAQEQSSADIIVQEIVTTDGAPAPAEIIDPTPPPLLPLDITAEIVSPQNAEPIEVVAQPTPEPVTQLQEEVSPVDSVPTASESNVAVVENTDGLTPTPVLTTDKDDYHPGTVATIFGNFFAPLQNFVLKIFGSDENDQNYTESTQTVATDGNGSFSSTYLLDSLYRPFYRVAVTTPTGTAVADSYFRDSSIGTYDQCANDLGVGYTSGPDLGCKWIQGAIQSNNSVYLEGDSTVQRMWIEGYAPGSTHTVTFQYGTTKGGHHAYDYLTTWDASENWVLVADRCQDITGCTTAAETQFAMKNDLNVTDTIEPATSTRKFTIRGGTISSTSVPTIVSGTYAGDSETAVTVAFTVAGSGSMCATKQGVTSCGIALWFGAHVAKSSEWTVFNGTTGAGSINGSPYHVALDKEDGTSVGQRDNQMQSAAIVVPSTITIHKVTSPNASDSTSFSFTTTGTGYAGFTLTGGTQNQQTVIGTGSFSVTETVPSGWSNTGLTCTASGTGSSATPNLTNHSVAITIGLSGGATIDCVYTNTLQQAHLTLQKTVVNDNGGTALDTAWTLAASGPTSVSGVEGNVAVTNAAVNAGTYTLSETGGPSGYTASTTWVCSGVTVTNGNQITLSAGNVATCTITNNDNAPSLTLVKQVITDNGGTAVPADWTLAATGPTGFSGIGPSVSNGASFDAGTYDLSESVALTGYANGTEWVCVGGTQGDVDTITLGLGESATCTITNRDLPGTISGHKFEDVNGNGTWDNGEPALLGWTINLEGTEVGSDVTDANGYYEFTDLSKGTYTVTETQQTGWKQTTTDPSQIDLDNDESVTDVDFGNFKLGSVSGQKFEDSDGDGLAREDGEPYLVGWTMRLYKTSSAPWELIASDVTDATGAYSFEDLELGDYKVCEVLQSGWTQTFPNIGNNNSSPSTADEGQKCQTVIIDKSDDNSNTRNIGNFKLGKISGYKFEDVNGNGAWDNGEPALSGWTINLGGSGNASDVTDTSGFYEFTGLTAGTYSLTENTQTGWTQKTTNPANVGVISGTDSQNNNFGNFNDVTISAYKFDDKDGDGVKDVEDTAIEGWEMTLNAAQAQDTNASGKTSWVVTVAGDYTIAEESQTGWNNTTPASVLFSDVASGDSEYTVEFLNTKLGSISGHKFHDRNMDDVKGVGEEYLAGWEIKLSGTDGKGNAVDLTTSTDANGEYAFTNLMPGTYAVTETPQNGWSQTTADPVAIELTSGENVTDVDFGNVALGTIIIEKELVSVNTDSDSTEFSFETDFDGTYTLVSGGTNEKTDLLPGSYSATEVNIPLGFVLTDIACSDENSTGDEETGIASITLDPGEIVTCTFTNNEPEAHIVLTPPTATNEIGDDHVITANVQVHNGDGILEPATNGTLVAFSITNSNGATAAFVGDDTCTTTAGTCSVTINSPTSGGVAVHASSTPTPLGVALTVETGTGGNNSADATKTYVDANIVLSPLTATNNITDPHTIFATVKQDLGDGVGMVNAPNGTLATFSLVNNTAGATFVGGVNTCTTTAGACSVTINSATPGSVDIHAVTTFTVDGVSLTRATGDGLSGDSVDANKRYVAGALEITKVIEGLNTVVNASAINDTFTVTVTGPSYPIGYDIVFTLTGGVLQTPTTVGLSQIIPGEYTVTEADAGTEWTEVVATSPVTVVASATSSVMVTNTYVPGSLEVTKELVLGGYSLPVNASFDVAVTGPSYPGGTTLTFAVVDGVVVGPQTLANLIPGEYVVTENNPGIAWTVTGGGNVAVNSGEQAESIVTNTLKQPHTTIAIHASTQETLPGENVIFTITDTNDGAVPLTNPSVVLTYGSTTVTLDKTHYYVSGDTNDDGVMDVGEAWVWSYSVLISANTTFNVAGHGLDPLGNDISPENGYTTEAGSVVVKVVGTTRTLGFWQTHTDFTSLILGSEFGTDGLLIGNHSTHKAGTATGAGGLTQAELFGGFYAPIAKTTTGAKRTPVDQARIQLLQQLLAAKLNCVAFGCMATVQTSISNADVAYATGNKATIISSAGLLDAFNNSGDAYAIPAELPATGKATPKDSQSLANKAFWNAP